MSSGDNNLYGFGDFRFNADALTLWRGEQMISLPPKALELLGLLIERRGEIVSKQEIFAAIWSGTFVEEGVLTQNVYTLRKALGVDENGRQFIENVARRGYRLSVPVYDLTESNLQPATISTPNGTGGEILLAAETRTEIFTEEIIEETDPPRLTGKTPFYRRKFFAFSGGGLIAAALVVFLLYLFPPRQLSSFFNSRTAEMQFQRLTDTGDVAYLVISPDGEFVAFNRGTDIYLKDLRSDGEIKLDIMPAARVGNIQFSADSRFIFFRDTFGANAPGKILQISRLGGASRVAAENVWSAFSLSPDGRTLAFHRRFPDENRWTLTLKDLETGTERELAPRVPPEEYYWNNYPAWSPDGRKIAAVIVSRTEHFLRLLSIDIASGNEEEIKMPKFRNVEQVIWSGSSDGSFLASASDGKNFQLWRISFPDGAARRITNDLNSYLGLSLTRDGRKLLARQRIYYSNIWVSRQTDLENLRQLTVGTSRNDGLKGLAWLGDEKVIYASNAEKLRDWNLWTVDAADKTRREVTFDDETQNEDPAVSPDDRHVYFSSNRGTEAHVWRVGIGEGSPEQVTSRKNEAELFPQISPDGAWLYYIQKGRNSSAVWRKSLVQDRAESLTAGQKLAPGTFLSLSPDGRYLAFQNLTGKADASENAETFQVAIINTENPSEVRFFNLPTVRQFIKWNAAAVGTFDYVVDSLEKAEIWRQSLDANSPPTLILSLQKDDIFNFAWSRDGQRLALARGQLLRDVVLLSDFGE